MNAIDVVRNDERVCVHNPRLTQLIEWLDTDFTLEESDSHRDIDIIMSNEKDYFHFVGGDRCPPGVIVGVTLNVKHVILMEDIELVISEDEEH